MSIQTSRTQKDFGKCSQLHGFPFIRLPLPALMVKNQLANVLQTAFPHLLPKQCPEEQSELWSFLQQSRLGDFDQFGSQMLPDKSTSIRVYSCPLQLWTETSCRTAVNQDEVVQHAADNRELAESMSFALSDYHLLGCHNTALIGLKWENPTSIPGFQSWYGQSRLPRSYCPANNCLRQLDGPWQLVSHHSTKICPYLHVCLWFYQFLDPPPLSKPCHMGPHVKCSLHRHLNPHTTPRGPSILLMPGPHPCSYPCQEQAPSNATPCTSLHAHALV